MDCELSASEKIPKWQAVSKSENIFWQLPVEFKITSSDTEGYSLYWSLLPMFGLTKMTS